jgi:hypothetical protein
MNRRTSRRAFFTQGGAALGAGVATTVGGSALASENKTPVEQQQLRKLRQQLHRLEDREAIRGLHMAFTNLVEQTNYEAAAQLFDERGHLDLTGVSATGRRAILELFVSQYRDERAARIHSAYRQSALRPPDAVTFSEDGLRASGTFHVEVELRTPLQGDRTVAQMARLQGHVSDRHWEAGRFEAKYVKVQGAWKIVSLSYQT